MKCTITKTFPILFCVIVGISFLTYIHIFENESFESTLRFFYNENNASNTNSESYENDYNINPMSVEEEVKNIRVLCWIMTVPSNHETRAIHIKRTWASRCNKALFVSTAKVNNSEMETIIVDLPPSRDFIWGRAREALIYIYENHFEDAEWFLRAEDDTYVILENLRMMLYFYNPNSPIYFGCKYKPDVKQGYMAAGPGYVISKAALQMIVTEAIYDKTKCRLDPGGKEDVELGLCMENVGVIAGDSRDPDGFQRFLPFKPEDDLVEGRIGSNSWYWSHTFYETEMGPNCCSPHAISFHGIKSDDMYVIDFMIYSLKTYGLDNNDGLFMN